MSDKPLSAHDLIEQEEERREAHKRKVQQRRTAARALEADALRLEAEESRRIGETAKKEAEYREKMEGMTDSQYQRAVHDLLREDTRKHRIRRGAKLTLG